MRTANLRSFAVYAALVAACAAVRPTPARADDLDDRIADLKDYERAGEEDECLRKMEDLQDAFADARAVKAVKDMIASKSERLACAAVAMIANRKPKDPDFLNWLCAKLDARLRPEPACSDAMFKAVLDGLVAYGSDKPSQAALAAAITTARPKLAAFVADNRSKEWVSGCASHAVAAYGLVRDKAGFEQLLAWGEQIESRAAVKGGDAASEDDEVKRAVLDTLAAMTGTKAAADVASWRRWWTEHAATFSFDAPAEPAAPAPPTAPASAPPPPVVPVPELIKAIKDAEKAGDEAKCLAKIAALKDSDDPRVLTVMKELFRASKSDKVVCAAMNWITGTRDAEFYKGLVSKIDDKDLFRRRDGRPEVYKTLLEDLALYVRDNQDKSALKPLDEAVKRFIATDSEYATRAIRAYGAVREPAVVEQLIAWLEEVESRGQSQGGKNENADARKRKDDAKKAILETLKALVGPDIPDAATWTKFWNEKKKGFVFPDPHKPKEPDVDVTKLTEWTDTVYGYTVKRPDGKLWTFKGKDDWFRIQTIAVDEKNVWWCWGAWGVYKLDAKIKDPKTYAEWWANEEFGKTAAEGKEFDEYAVGGEPKIDERKFAGREWMHVVAKGKTKGGFVKWGAFEKHVYITKLDYQLLYAVGTVSTGAEPEDRLKLLGFIEGITFVK
jgi:hypothetical protein